MKAGRPAEREVDQDGITFTATCRVFLDLIDAEKQVDECRALLQWRNYFSGLCTLDFWQAYRSGIRKMQTYNHNLYANVREDSIDV